MTWPASRAGPDPTDGRHLAVVDNVDLVELNEAFAAQSARGSQS